MANVSFALVLNLHQPAWNLEDLLQHREWEAKEGVPYIFANTFGAHAGPLFHG
jgi:hypothetical protein